MRICFLVLTHYQPSVVARLVRELTSDGDPVVIHVDSKVDQAQFEAAIAPSDLVHYETERVDVKWGGSSIMAAQVAIMRTGLRVAPDADYFWLLSGDSYVTQPVGRLKEFLAAQYPTEYLNVVRMPADEFAKPISRLTNFRFDFDARTSRFRVPLLALNRLSRRPWRHHFRGMQPWGGSSWFTLTRPATQYLLDYLDARPRFCRYVRHTGAPEEWLPHTLLVNHAAFRYRIRGALFWADFRPTTPPPRPPALTSEHVAYLQQLLGDPQADFATPGPPFVTRKFGPDSDRLAAQFRADLWPIRVPSVPAADHVAD